MKVQQGMSPAVGVVAVTEGDSDDRQRYGR